MTPASEIVPHCQNSTRERSIKRVSSSLFPVKTGRDSLLSACCVESRRRGEDKESRVEKEG